MLVAASCLLLCGLAQGHVGAVHVGAVHLGPVHVECAPSEGQLAGDGPVASAAPALDLRQPRHVRALYLDTLGRTPDADELDLARHARPAVLLALLVGSREFWDQWYEEELYYLLLLDNFRPEDSDDPGQGLPARLASGELDVLSALRTLASGSAFHRANPGNDTFVSVVFEQLLGLTVQDNGALLEGGKKMYDGKRASLWGMPGDSQSDVVRIACAQPAFVRRFVARQHERFVGLPADAADLERWSQQLAAEPGSFTRLVGEWLGGPHYAERLQSLRLKSDRQFVRGLYVDLVGRPPGQDTYQRYRTALAAVADGGPLRSVIARVLLDAEGAGLPAYQPTETEQLVRDVYERFLGRQPGPGELEALILLHDQGGATGIGIVRAITTHWEYQYY